MIKVPNNMLLAVLAPIRGLGRGPLEAPITAQASSGGSIHASLPHFPLIYKCFHHLHGADGCTSQMDLAGAVKIADFSLHSCQKKKEKKTAILLLWFFIEAPVSSADMSPSQQKQKSPVSQDIKRAHFIATRSLAQSPPQIMKKTRIIDFFFLRNSCTPSPCVAGMNGYKPEVSYTHFECASNTDLAWNNKISFENVIFLFMWK